MNATGVQGIKVGGREPQALLLSDGTRLALEEEGPGGRADWVVVGDDPANQRGLSVADAMRIAGERHAEYIRIRTRAEVAWLQVVSEWFDREAARLDRELSSAG